MKIGLVSIAYNAGEHTKKQFDSIIPNSQHEIIPFLFLHNDRSQELIEECEKLTEKYNIHYYPYGQNRGCSKSQNEGVYLAFTRYGCDVVLGICQDVYYNTLEAFDNWIEQCKQYIDTHYIISKWMKILFLLNTKIWILQEGVVLLKVDRWKIFGIILIG